MDSSRQPLTPLQGDLLEAFFDRTQGFFLTGGAALAAFYLHHRETKDLDLFATPETRIRLEDACSDALKKHASADPATLAYAISQLPLGPRSVIPPSFEVAALEQFRSELVDQLTRLAFPTEPSKP